MTPVIPRQFIFVYGLKKQRQPFPLCHFLCIESCFQVHGPERILFFYHHEPHGPYWELAKKRVVPVRIARKHRISIFRYGLKNRACWKYRYAHQSDFIRLEKLLEYGGVYADIDTLFVQPFPEHFWENDFVLGREGDIVCGDSGEKRQSLCNALIMAKRDAPFGRIWLERMRTAFDGTWSNHSTLLPFELSQRHPELVHIEPARSFYKHLWTPHGLHLLLQGCDPDFRGVYSMHLWAHLWWSEQRRDFSTFHAGMLSEKYVREVDTTYNIVARKFLPQGPERQRPGGRVSVIIPTCDRPALLRMAVQSLLRQSRPAAEIIVVNDGSSQENRREIEKIAAWDPSISIFHFAGNMGVSAARNFGLAKATGDLVVFLDDDDLLHARALELGMDFFADHPAADVMVCRSRMFTAAAPSRLSSPERSPKISSRGKFWLIDQAKGKRLEKNPFREILRFAIPINSVMFRRACLEKSSFQADLRMGEERLLLLNLAHRGCRFVFHPRNLAFVRMHSGNAQRKPGADAESVRYLTSLLDSQLPANGHDRFICHARLLQLGLRLQDRSVFSHLRFLLHFPNMIVMYGGWYLLVQIKKMGRRRYMAAAMSKRTGGGTGP